MTMDSIVYRPLGKGLVTRMLGSAALIAGAVALPANALAQAAPAAAKSQPAPLFPTEQAPAAPVELTSAPVIQEIPTDYFTVAPTWQVAQAQAPPQSASMPGTLFFTAPSITVSPVFTSTTCSVPSCSI